MGYNNVLEGGGEQNEVGDNNYIFLYLVFSFHKKIGEILLVVRDVIIICVLYSGGLLSATVSQQALMKPGI